MDENKIDPGHNATRDTLRVVGPIVLVMGLGFMAVALVDFFMAFGGHRQPILFWCFFVAIPLLFAGGVMTQMAFLGTLTKLKN